MKWEHSSLVALSTLKTLTVHLHKYKTCVNVLSYYPPLRPVALNLRLKMSIKVHVDINDYKKTSNRIQLSIISPFKTDKCEFLYVTDDVFDSQKTTGAIKGKKKQYSER